MSARQAIPLLGVLAILGACTPRTGRPEEMLAAADSLDRLYLQAFNTRNVEALTALYWDNPDVVSIGPDGTMTRGRPAIRASLTATFASMPGARLEFIEMHNVAVDGVVIGWGRSRATIPADSGPPIVLEGGYSDVKAQKDGRWSYVLDHVSVPFAPAQPAKN